MLYPFQPGPELKECSFSESSQQKFSKVFQKFPKFPKDFPIISCNSHVSNQSNWNDFSPFFIHNTNNVGIYPIQKSQKDLFHVVPFHSHFRSSHLYCDCVVCMFCSCVLYRQWRNTVWIEERTGLYYSFKSVQSVTASKNCPDSKLCRKFSKNPRYSQKTKKKTKKFPNLGPGFNFFKVYVFPRYFDFIYFANRSSWQTLMRIFFLF